MPARLSRSALAATAIVAAAAAPASAATTPWKRISSYGSSVVMTATLARTPNGNLHVGYAREDATNSNSGWDVIVHPNGSATPTPIVQGWYSIGDTIALTRHGSGVAAYIGADDDGSGPDGTWYTNGLPFGAPTLVHPTASDFAYSPSGPVAATAADGTQWYLYWATGELSLMRNQGPTAVDLEPAGYQSYDAGIGIDGGSGAVSVLSWGSSSSDRAFFLHHIDPATGAEIGTPARLIHGPSFASGDLGQPQAISGRGLGHPGVWMLYWKGNLDRTQLILRKVGGSAKLFARAPKSGEVARPQLTHDNKGRLWAVWLAKGAKQTIMARRSNLAGSAWGPATIVSLAKGSNGIYQLLANGERSDGVLDLVALFGLAKGDALEHAQIRPPLAFIASTYAVHAASGAKVVLTVSDPDAVAGATIKAHGPGGATATLTTDGNGHATLKIPRHAKVGDWKLSASAGGHAGARITVKVR